MCYTQGCRCILHSQCVCTALRSLASSVPTCHAHGCTGYVILMIPNIWQCNAPNLAPMSYSLVVMHAQSSAMKIVASACFPSQMCSFPVAIHRPNSLATGGCQNYHHHAVGQLLCSHNSSVSSWKLEILTNQPLQSTLHTVQKIKVFDLS